MGSPDIRQSLELVPVSCKCFLRRPTLSTGIFWTNFMPLLTCYLTDQSPSLLILKKFPAHLYLLWLGWYAWDFLCQANLPGPRSGSLNTSSSAGEEKLDSYFLPDFLMKSSSVNCTHLIVVGP